MAFDEVLAGRLRELAAEGGHPEKRMFGALAWFAGGNLAYGVIGDDLLVRVPRESYDAALREPGVRAFRFKESGRVMSGFVVVDGEVLDDDVLRSWVARGVSYASSLPPK